MQSKNSRPNTAKVYVLKEDSIGEEGKPWHVCSDMSGMVLVHHSADTWTDAWTWLDENYVRETP